MIDNNLIYLLAGCFGLGMLHGVIPDEHTWPITFSYSVGTATGKGGMMAGAFFSLAFTTQRAIMSQIVYFAVGAFLVSSDLLNGPVYSVVGLVMAIAGYLILKNKMPHIHPFMNISRKDLAKHIPFNKPDKKSKLLVPVHWCLIHGFISGFGVDTGIFSVWIYLVTLPAMASAGLWMLGWLPGTLFGIGTFVILVLIGFIFGEVLQVSKKFNAQRIESFGRLVGARVLLFGGILFIALGPLYYLGVDKLLSFDFGTFIILIVMIAIAVPIMAFTWHQLGKSSMGLIAQNQSK
ncbi:MAG: hypothetical protein ACP5NL_01360 [Thermoplasmata archaeon]